jgi:hypothetical protein
MFPSVVVPYFAVMDSSAGFCIGHVALFNNGINNPVIRAF